MSLTFDDITFDCADPTGLAEFWAAALDRPIGERSDDYASVPGAGAGAPSLHFIRVPEGKTAKNRIHFDLGTSARRDEVVRLVDLGATAVAERSENRWAWTVMQDPEGNEFCVVEDVDASADEAPP